jgi:hypothetical protein
VREVKNRNSRVREIAFHIVLYGFYGFDLPNNAKKIHVKNDPLHARITMREFQFFESIIEK